MVAYAPSTETMNRRLSALCQIAYSRSLIEAEKTAKQVHQVTLTGWGKILEVVKHSRGISSNEIRRRTNAVLDSMPSAYAAKMDVLFQELGERSYDEVFGCFEKVLSAKYWLEASGDIETRLRMGLREAKEKKNEPREIKVPKEPAGQDAPPPPAKLGERLKEPPTKSEIREIVKSDDYRDRLDQWANDVRNKHQVAERIIAGAASGKSVEDVAKEIEPFVRGGSSTAQRIVRTEAAHLHNQMAERVFEDFDDIIVGYQIVAILDARTRPTHARRNGTIFWKDGQGPKNGLSEDERPELPDEANCRCTYVPVLADAKSQKLAGVPLQDKTYDDWFKKQSAEVQADLVGRENYAEVKDTLASEGKKPAWGDFIDPQTGRPIPPEQLRNETAEEILERRAEHEKIRRANRDATKRVR